MEKIQITSAGIKKAFKKYDYKKAIADAVKRKVKIWHNNIV